MQQKAYQPHNPDTTSKKYIFNVHQITTSGENTDKNTAQNEMH